MFGIAQENGLGLIPAPSHPQVLVHAAFNYAPPPLSSFTYCCHSHHHCPHPIITIIVPHTPACGPYYIMPMMTIITQGPTTINGHLCHQTTDAITELLVLSC